MGAAPFLCKASDMSKPVHLVRKLVLCPLCLYSFTLSVPPLVAENMYVHMFQSRLLIMRTIGPTGGSFNTALPSGLRCVKTTKRCFEAVNLKQFDSRARPPDVWIFSLQLSVFTVFHLRCWKI